MQARDDPAKQRIRAWLSNIDDERLRGFGLSREEIAILRTSRADGTSREAEARREAEASAFVRPSAIASRKTK